MKLVSTNIQTVSTVESHPGIRRCPFSINGLLPIELTRRLWSYPVQLILAY